MSHPSERLSLLINTLSLNVNSFATECGYNSSTTIWRIINDNKKPSKPTIDKICARFKNVNKEWLLTGQGSMFFNKESSDDLTVTAKQSIDGIVLELEKKEVLSNNKLDLLIKKIDNIHERLLGLEYLKGLELKSKTKNKNEI